MRMTIRLALVAVMGLAHAACKNTPSTSTTGPSGEPTWEVNLRTTAITNQATRVLIVRIQQEGQSTVLGNTCDFIGSSPYTSLLAGITEVAASGNPCDLGAPKRFANGRYTLTAGIYAPQLSLQVAEIATTQTFVVNNDAVVVTINGSALSRSDPAPPPGPTPGNNILTILPATLPTLTVGVPVSITLSVVGGTGTGWVFSPNTVGTQIPGLSINAPNPGMLSGTPTTAGPYQRGISVIDSGSNTGTIVYSGTVLPAPLASARAGALRRHTP